MIEARTVTRDNAEELADWCGGQVVIEHDALDYDQSSPGINFQGKDGVLRASVGQTIVHNNDGHFYLVTN